jgi:S1-C subfamily serine protease
LKRTDIILSINDHPISSVDEMRITVAQITPGNSARLDVARDGRKRVINVTLDQVSDHPDELFTGVTVKPLATEDRRRLSIDPRVTGLLITDIADDSPFRDQLAVNAVIMEINRTPVTDLASAKEALSLQPNRALLAISYRGTIRFVVVTQ